MTSYEIIDTICDSINPLLFFITLGMIIKDLVNKEFKKSGVTFGYLFAGLALVYGLMFVDQSLEIWPSVGGDYSTHTAFIVAVCMALHLIVGKWQWLVGVYAVYMVLMMYQQYHTLFDIVTTTVVIVLPLLVGRVLAVKLINVRS